MAADKAGTDSGSVDLKRARELFDRALELEPDRRSGFLDSACGDDPRLRRELAMLLVADQQTAPSLEPGRRTEWPNIDGYDVAGEIERGGQGVVFEAHQASTGRKVAIKILHAGAYAAPAARVRFEREIELVAQLEHPNIITIFDSGTGPGGLRYFVMDHIDGVPLDRHVTERRLTVVQTLNLFVIICRAVNHAHQRGIIHRDLKPSNILVDSDSNPRILDFGLAKPVASEDAHEATMTGVILGTLQYLSPEQTRGRAAEIDVRADVYALGVMLYQVLTGSRPYPTDGSLTEAIRNINETPPTPARQAWQAETGVERAKDSHRRRPGRCPLDGDVETLLHKALAKERERRYQSVSELGHDLERYLANEPIEARRDSRWYVARKTLARHRLAAAAATAFVISVTTAALVLSVMYHRQLALHATLTGERDARQAALTVAERERNRADDELRTSNIERGRLFGRTGNLADAERLLWRAHLSDPGLATHWALWELYWRNPLMSSQRADSGRGGESSSPGKTVVRYSPDGHALATGGTDGVIRLRSASGYVEELDSGSGKVRAVSFSPDGAMLAAAHDRGSIVLWDLERRLPLHVLSGHEGEAFALAHHPTGEWLASGGDDGMIRVWQVSSGEPIAAVASHEQRIWMVAYSPDGSLLASAGADGAVRVWSMPGLRQRWQLMGHEGQVVSLAFSPDGHRLFSGGTDRSIRAWDVVSGEALATRVRPNGTVRAILLSHDGKTLASAGWWSLDLWDSVSLELRRSLPATSGLWSVDFSPREHTIAAGDADGVVRVWSSTPGSGELELDGHEQFATAAFHPSGALVVSGDGGGRLRLADGRTGRLLGTIEAHRERINSIELDPGGSTIASGGEDGWLRLWDLETGSLVRSFDDYRGLTSGSVGFSADGRSIAYASEAGTFAVRDARTGALRRRYQARGVDALGVRFGPDATIASTSRGTVLELWSASGRDSRSFPIGGPTWSVDVSPDGRRVAVGTWNRNIEIWSLLDGVRESVLTGHAGTVFSVAFKPDDGRILASGGGDGTVRLWDVEEKRSLATLEAFEGWDVRRVRFSADGRSLLAAGHSDRVRVWDLEHYERHVAGNLVYQMDRLGSTTDPVERGRLTAWAEEVLRRPWPRFGSDLEGTPNPTGEGYLRGSNGTPLPGEP